MSRERVSLHLHAALERWFGEVPGWNDRGARIDIKFLTAPAAAAAAAAVTVPSSSATVVTSTSMCRSTAFMVQCQRIPADQCHPSRKPWAEGKGWPATALLGREIHYRTHAVHNRVGIGSGRSPGERGSLLGDSLFV